VKGRLAALATSALLKVSFSTPVPAIARGGRSGGSSGDALLDQRVVATFPSLPTWPLLQRDRMWRTGRATLAAFGALWLVWLFVVQGGGGADAMSYWRVPHGLTLYAGTDLPGGIGVFRYSPAFAQAVSPLSALPFDAFRLVWLAGSLVALGLVAGRWSLVLLALPPVWLDLYLGNVHLLLALAIAVGFRYPAAWAFVLLTKVTPGVGLLWFAVRREWRSLSLALGATVAVVAASGALGGIGPWADWVRSLSGSSSAADVWPFPVPPLWLRMVGAAALIVWGARRDRVWVVPMAATLALPTIWGHGPAMLVAIVPLVDWSRCTQNDDRKRAGATDACVLGRDPTAPPVHLRQITRPAT
jgi:Glycosyltransferase family 87